MRPYHFFLRREGVRGISLLIVFLFHQCLRKFSATSFYVVFCHLFLCSCPTELISTYLDKIMAPSVKTLLSYIYGTANTRLKFFLKFCEDPVGTQNRNKQPVWSAGICKWSKRDNRSFASDFLRTWCVIFVIERIQRNARYRLCTLTDVRSKQFAIFIILPFNLERFLKSLRGKSYGFILVVMWSLYKKLMCSFLPWGVAGKSYCQNMWTIARASIYIWIIPSTVWGVH